MAGARALGPPETVNHVGHLLRGNSRTAIVHYDHDLGGTALNLDLQGHAGRCIAQHIVDKNRQQLANAGTVSV